jgi:hypothetical protein
LFLEGEFRGKRDDLAEKGALRAPSRGRPKGGCANRSGDPLASALWNRGVGTHGLREAVMDTAGCVHDVVDPEFLPLSPLARRMLDRAGEIASGRPAGAREVLESIPATP